MSQTLATAKESIERFLLEAKECAEIQCGFSTMLTAFSVILAVSEAIEETPGKRNEDLMRRFPSRLNDKTSWLTLPREVTFVSDKVGTKLADLRDSLAHQLSMPTDTVLANNREEARLKSSEHPDKYIISTKEFVEAIRGTVERILAENPTAVLDPRPREPSIGPLPRELRLIQFLYLVPAEGFRSVQQGLKLVESDR